MHERVSRLPRPVEPRKAAVLLGEQVTKLYERPPQILRRVGPFHAVMQVNLHFAEAVRFQFGQPLDERTVILLAGIKVRVAERRPVAISRHLARGAGLLTPFIHARELRRQSAPTHSLVPRRLEMVRHDQDEVRATAAGDPTQRPPRQLAGPPQWITAEPGERPFELI